VSARGLIAAALISAALPIGSARAEELALTVGAGVTIAASATDQNGASFTIAGMSGVAYAGPVGDGAHAFWVVLDNSDKLVLLHVRFAGTGAVSSAAVVRGLRLADVLDFEDIAITSAGTALLVEEGTPSIREYNLTSGAFVRAIAPPAVFSNRRANFGFESLTLATPASSAWTANEEALTPDGPLSTAIAGSVVRLLQLQMPGGVAQGQFAYRTEAMHGPVIGGGRSGLSALVQLPSRRLIALERSLAATVPPFLSRFYEVTVDGATDVSGLPALASATYTAVSKRLLLSTGQTNLEGLCLGPRLDSGGYVMLGVVDDADPISVNRVVSFVITGPVAAACRADINGDGFIDFFDFDDFVSCFEGSACPAGTDADFNADGFVDFFDFDDFVAAFEVGC
jgi:hypothetical protein